MIPSTNITINNSCIPNVSTQALMPFYKKNLHSREIDVKKILGQKALQFDTNDLKPKLLYLMAQGDDTNAFPINTPFLSIESFINRIHLESSTNKEFSDIIKNLKQHQEKASQGDQKSIKYLKAYETGLNQVDHGVGRFLKILDKNFDIRFKVISSVQEMCEEILAASKINNFKSLIFSAHGLSNAIIISDNELILQHPENQTVVLSATYINNNGMPEVNKILSRLNENCFTGLPSDATITLLSCNTGAIPTSIASTISKASQLDVWAPENFITLVKTELSLNTPPIPTFWNARKSENSFFDDHACKFSPDGVRKCGALNAKLLPLVIDYAPLLILSFTALYYVNKYIKPWICRKIYKVQKSNS